MTKKNTAKKSAAPKKAKIIKSAVCPNCEVDLENNLSTFAEVLKAVGDIKEKALTLQQKEFACLECDHEWGDEMGTPPAATTTTETPMQKIAAAGKSETPVTMQDAVEAVDGINKSELKTDDQLAASLTDGGAVVVISAKTGQPVKQYQNPSTVAKPVGRVHEIAADMIEADPATRRKDIIAACVAIGINIHTAKTQVQVYLKGLKDDAAAKLAASLTTKKAASA